MSETWQTVASPDQDGRTVAGGASVDAPRLGFDEAVPAGGYRWWYVDAISDDGAHALTLIAFIGSVFSPYYARARARGVAQAEDHCAVNLALYEPPARWCMTERNRHSLQTTASSLRIGPSSLQVKSNASGTARRHELVIDIDEVSVPLPRRLQGRLIVTLPAMEFSPVSLDAQRCHTWQPIAPRTRIAVQMNNPSLTWHGNAYVDGNRGSVALENSFRSWEWSRSHRDDGSTVIQYDVTAVDGAHQEKTFVFDATGTDQSAGFDGDVVDPLIRQTLDNTRWFRIPRATRTDADATISKLSTLEDTPFYARSRFRTAILGQACDCLHESLLLNRFDRPLTRLMLPFRMPRRSGRRSVDTAGVDSLARRSTPRLKEPHHE